MAKCLFVLDSWAIMEWLKAREPVAARFDELTDMARSGGEMLHNSYNVWGVLRADEILAELDALPVHVFHPRQEDVMAAARLKARFRCSFADAFAVVLAAEFDGIVVTGDPDFLKMREGGVVGVEWWGA